MRRNGGSTTGLLRLMEKRNRPRSLLALATKQREDAPVQPVQDDAILTIRNGDDDVPWRSEVPPLDDEWWDSVGWW